MLAFSVKSVINLSLAIRRGIIKIFCHFDKVLSIDQYVVDDVMDQFALVDSWQLNIFFRESYSFYEAIITNHLQPLAVSCLISLLNHSGSLSLKIIALLGI